MPSCGGTPSTAHNGDEQHLALLQLGDLLERELGGR
jgi:hypothetical protein